MRKGFYRRFLDWLELGHPVVLPGGISTDALHAHAHVIHEGKHTEISDAIEVRFGVLTDKKGLRWQITVTD